MQKVTPIVSPVKRVTPYRRSTTGIGRWNKASVRSAIDNQIAGDFNKSSQLARAMQQDATFAAAIDKRCLSFVRTDFTIIPANQSTENISIANSIEKEWHTTILSELALKRLLKSYLCTGVALAFFEWNYKDNLVLPTIKVLDTENLKYNQSTSTWTYQSATGMLDVVPGDGSFLLISEWAPGELTGFISSLGNEWVTKELTKNDWLKGNQSQGESVAIISDSGTGIADINSDINSLVSEIQEQKSDKVIYCPPGKSITFEDSSGNFNTTSFKDLIEQCNRTILLRILGGNMGSEIISGGSYAAAQVHAGVEISLVESDIEIFTTELHKQLMKWIIELNFGDKEIPWPSWAIADEINLEAMANNLKTFKEFIGTEYEISNIEDIADEFGIKLKKKTVL